MPVGQQVATKHHLTAGWVQLATSLFRTGTPGASGPGVWGIGWAPLAKDGTACACTACLLATRVPTYQRAITGDAISTWSRQAQALDVQLRHLHSNHPTQDAPGLVGNPTAAGPAMNSVKVKPVAWLRPPFAAASSLQAPAQPCPVHSDEMQDVAWEAAVRACNGDLQEILILTQQWLQSGLSPAQVQQIISAISTSHLASPSSLPAASIHDLAKLSSTLVHACISWLREQELQQPAAAPLTSPEMKQRLTSWQHAQHLIAYLAHLSPLLRAATTTSHQPHHYLPAPPAQQLELSLRHALQSAAAPPTAAAPGLVPYLIPIDQLITALQAMLDAGVQDHAAYTALGNLLLPVLPSAPRQAHSRTAWQSAPGLTASPSPHQLAHIITGFAQASCCHASLFHAVSAALLSGRGEGRQSPEPSAGVLDSLNPPELASLMVACAKLGQHTSALMDACSHEASRWLGQQAESSLLGLLSRVTRATAAAQPPEPHPLQPFTLPHLADMATALITTDGPLGRPAAALLEAIEQEATAQLLVLVEGGRSGSSRPAAAAVSPVICRAVVEVVHALHARGPAKPLLLDTAAAVLASRLELLTPEVSPDQQLTSLQHQPQLLAALSTSLTTHVQSMQAPDVTFVTQRLATSKQTCPDLQQRLSARMVQLLKSPAPVAAPAVSGVTFESLTALPAAAGLIIAQASQGYRDDQLIGCVDHVLHVCSQHVGVHSFLTPYQLIGLAAACTQLAVHAPAVLQQASSLAAAATSTPPVARPGPRSSLQSQPLSSQTPSNKTCWVPRGGLPPSLTLSHLAQLMWSLLITPHLPRLHEGHQQPDEVQQTHRSATPPHPPQHTPTRQRDVPSRSSSSSRPELSLVLRLYGRALEVSIDDVFDPTVILLAQVHMLLLSRLGPGFIESLMLGDAQLAPTAASYPQHNSSSGDQDDRGRGAAGDAGSMRPAITQLANSLRYAWGQHLKASANTLFATHQPHEGRNHSGMQLDSKQLQSQVLQAMRQLGALGVGPTEPHQHLVASALSRSSRPVWLKVDGFPVAVDVAGEAGGRILAVMCHGTDRVCRTTQVHEAGGAATAGYHTSVLGEVVWLEVLLQQLGWLVIQVPAREWQAPAHAASQSTWQAQYLWSLLSPVIL